MHGVAIAGSPFALDIITGLPFDSVVVPTSADPTGATLLQYVAATLPQFANGKAKLRLLFRASRDGWAVGTGFHLKCDNQGPTVVVIKVDAGGGLAMMSRADGTVLTFGEVAGGGSHVFGGIVSTAWASAGYQTAATHACMFGLGCAGSATPVRLPLKAGMNANAMYNSAGCGPLFGQDATDLNIATNANTSRSSNSNGLGTTYTLPPGGNGRTFFAGANNFQVAEYEVFAIEPSA
jgi:hypothetical protein